MVGGSQILLEGLWSMMQDGLAGRKEVMMIFTFLSYSLLLKLLHKSYGFPMGYSRLRRSHSCSLTMGIRIGNLGFLEPVAPYCFGFLDSHPIVAFSLQNCLGAVHLGMKGPLMNGQLWLFQWMWPQWLHFGTAVALVPRSLIVF